MIHEAGLKRRASPTGYTTGNGNLATSFGDWLVYGQTLFGPELEKEFRFHPIRKWRADFAHIDSRTLIEIAGGIYINGRHNRAGGFAAASTAIVVSVLPQNQIPSSP